MIETKKTYCRVCEPNCGLVVTLEDGKIVKAVGNKDHPLTRGFICARGVKSVDIHNDPDRVSYPIKREGSDWRVVEWKDALGDIGAKLKAIRQKHGPHSIGFYFGNPTAFDFTMAMYLSIFNMSLRTRNIFSSGSQDCNNKFVASELLYGSPILHPVPDVDGMDFLILFGSNPSVSGSSFMSLPRSVERLKKITARGGRVILIDPRKTESAHEFGEHVFIRPDTDVFLLMAMLNVIVREGLVDKGVIEGNTRGYDDLKKFVAKWTPEKAAEVTGIQPKIIESLAVDFAKAKNAGIHGSLGINVGSFGTINYWLIQCLNAVTGRLDRAGSMIFCEGFVNLPKILRMMKKPGVGHRSRIGGYQTVLDTLPAGIMADEMLTPGDGQIKALIVACGNPLLTVPDPDKLKKALSSLELVVSIDLFVNETGGFADYVLPGTDFFERWDCALQGLHFNPTRFINYTDPVVKPAGERKDTWVILHEIIKAGDFPLAKSSAFTVVAKALDGAAKALGAKEPISVNPGLMLKAMLLGSGVSVGKLRKNPDGILLDPHRVGRFFTNRIQTDDKKIDLAPPAFIAEKETIEKFHEDEKSWSGFKIIHQRQRRSHNSWFHNLEAFSGAEKTNKASINPRDAAELGISDGDSVEVKSGAASVVIPAIVTDDVMPGVIAIPHGWGHEEPSNLSVAKKNPGVNVNKLFPSGPETLEKFAGMCKLTGARASLRKA